MRNHAISRFIAILTAVALLISASACGSTAGENAAEPTESADVPAEPVAQPVFWKDWESECELRGAVNGSSARLIFTDRDGKNLFSFNVSFSGKCSVKTSLDTWSFEKWKQTDSADFSYDYKAADDIVLSAVYYYGESDFTFSLHCGDAKIGTMSIDAIAPRTIGKIEFCSAETEGGLELINVASYEATRNPSAMETLLSENSRDSADFYLKLATQATQDMIDNFCGEDPKYGMIVLPTINGFPVEGNGDSRGSVWETSFIITGLYDLFLLTGEDSYRQLLLHEADFYADSVSYEEWANASGNFNWASDDCAWNCLLMLLLYDVSGDERLVQNVIGLTDSVLDRWYDEELNGIFYKDGVDFMSLYEVGLTFSWLRLWEITGEQRFYDLAFRSYNGMHDRLGAGRDDGLYFCEANKYMPRGDADSIGEAGSASFLAGNLGMAALSARFYRLTGNEEYLSRVYRTNDGILAKYVRDGVLLNDRDAWTNAAFTAFYVSEVLSLPDTEEMQQVIYDTAYSIAANARTYDGHYGGSWQGPAVGSGSTWHCKGSTAYQSNTSGTSVLMITAAALLEAGIDDYRR